MTDYQVDRALTSLLDDDEGERYCCECGETISEHETGNDTSEGLMCDSCYLASLDEQEDMDE